MPNLCCQGIDINVHVAIYTPVYWCSTYNFISFALMSVAVESSLIFPSIIVNSQNVRYMNGILLTSYSGAIDTVQSFENTSSKKTMVADAGLQAYMDGLLTSHTQATMYTTTKFLVHLN